VNELIESWVSDETVVEIDDLMAVGLTQSCSSGSDRQAQCGAERPGIKNGTKPNHGIGNSPKTSKGISDEIELHALLTHRLQRGQITSAATLEHMGTNGINANLRWLEDAQESSALGPLLSLDPNLHDLTGQRTFDQHDSPVSSARQRCSSSDETLSGDGLGGPVNVLVEMVGHARIVGLYRPVDRFLLPEGPYAELAILPSGRDSSVRAHS